MVVAVLALPVAWTAYQLEWIRQRHAFLAKTQTRFLRGRVDFLMATDSFYQRMPRRVSPWSLRIFREPAVGGVWVSEEEKDDELWELAGRLFPEAERRRGFLTRFGS